MIDHAHSTGNTYVPSGGYAASRDAGYDAYVCPVCGQPGLIRVRRRLIDRILSLFVTQRRFRCTQPGCSWQGNLRKSPRTRAAKPEARD